MFGKYNPSINRIRDCRKDALNGAYRNVSCACEIIPFVEAFFKKSIKYVTQWEKYNSACGRIESIAEIVKYLAMNTRNYKPLSAEDLVSIKKIFEEVDLLYSEAITLDHSVGCKRFNDRCSCIEQIICKNMVGMYDYYVEDEDYNPAENYRDGMIFQSYENLWEVVHRINTEWDALCSRGFSLRVFYDFRDAIKYERDRGQERAEEEKIKDFMALLDGTMKFVPVYEHKPVCYKLVDNDFEGDIVNCFKNQYSDGYAMEEKK